MSRFGVVVHQQNPHAARWAGEAVAWAAGAGHDIVAVPEDHETIEGIRGPSGAVRVIAAEDVADADIDLMISIGGDGTILRTVALVGESGVPVLGVNVGQLGYLTSVEPPAMTVALAAFVNGTAQVEERMLLEAAVVRADGSPGPYGRALNEAVIEKQTAGHTVRLLVHIGERPFTVYAADGLIVSTPTGSTAYSLSAGGPIVSPRHRALVMTPVAPHMLFDRSLVLAPDESVTLEVLGHRPAAATIDGRSLGGLEPGDRLCVRTAARSARFVSVGERSFHQVLKAKFGLLDR